VNLFGPAPFRRREKSLRSVWKAVSMKKTFWKTRLFSSYRKVAEHIDDCR